MLHVPLNFNQLTTLRKYLGASFWLLRKINCKQNNSKKENKIKYSCLPAFSIFNLMSYCVDVVLFLHSDLSVTYFNIIS